MVHDGHMRVLESLGLLCRRSVWLPGAVAACAHVGSEIKHACTEIGCIEAASIAINESDWSYSELALELEVDGRRVRCNSAMMGQGSCDDARVTVGAEELADCVETRTQNSASSSCAPNGKFRHMVFMEGTPQRVAVSVTRPDGSTSQREFELEYQPHRPNGPECGPVCNQAKAQWTL